MNLPSEKIESFQDKIIAWYKVNKRDLPWRRTRDPYKILLSEIMSQQTQISRVIPKYLVWLEVFPTVESLATSQTSKVLEYWSGLGYNRRALYLQKTAQEVVKKYQGKFPHKIEILEMLPGIGKYTAAAVACFAFDKQIAVVDTNIRKVITVEFFEGELPHEKTIESVAFQLLPQGKAYEWNQALMDYASSVLKKEKIPIPKQSHFKTSDRYFRGQTIKLLLIKKSIMRKELLAFYIHQLGLKDLSRGERILTKLIRDGLVVERQDRIMLP